MHGFGYLFFFFIFFLTNKILKITYIYIDFYGVFTYDGGQSRAQNARFDLGKDVKRFREPVPLYIDFSQYRLERFVLQ